MRTLVIISLSVCLLTLSCKRDDETNSWTAHYTIQGKLYNSVTGYVMPGQQVFFYFGSPVPHSPTTMITDQNGIFYCNWKMNFNNGSYTGPGTTGNPCFLYTCVDTLAVMQIFDFGELKDNGVYNIDIHAEPVGYLALTLSDTSLFPNCTIDLFSYIAGYCGFYWNYNAQQNNYSDTTNILKIYGNTFVRLWCDTVYVPRGDTVAMTIYY